MPRGPHYVESKGACIYCGACDVALSDEHVVPYSLGGTHVLRKASCARCADVTTKFERKVGRDLWGDARTAFNAPSRRRKQRRKKLVMPNPTGRGKGLAIPAAEYPAGFVFYKMCQAGLLQGLPPGTDLSGTWQPVVIDDDRRRGDFQKKHPTTPLMLAHSGETDHRFRCEAGQRFRSNWTPVGAKRRGSGIMSRGGWSGSTLVVVFASILPSS